MAAVRRLYLLQTIDCPWYAGMAMGQNPGILVLAGAVASGILIFSLTRGMKMRDDKRPLAELLWYAGGLLPLAGVCLFWASMGDQPVIQQRIVLFIVGAAIGGCALLAAGELVRPLNAQTSSNPIDKPSVNVTGSNNVLSFGQKGGQTANTIINQAPPSRLISQAVGNDIVNELRAAGPRSVVVSGQQGDSEINQFASQLVGILRTAGWTAQGPNVIMGMAPVTGLFILVKSPDNPPETAGILQNILKRNGVDAPASVDPSLQPDQVVLFVGARPG